MPLACTAALLTATASTHAARVKQTIPGDQLPQRLRTTSLFIISGSDSLSIGGQLLVKGIDYRFVGGEGYFDLNDVTLGSGDTLTVVYRSAPRWVPRSYGTPVPALEQTVSPTVQTGEGERSVGRMGTGWAGSDIKLSGAKTFRFSTRSTGGSEFGQSLDLSIRGEVSPGLEITGAVSDRGYDPTYGTANSRLNELDKVNLSLRSQRLLAQVGDITLRPATVGGPAKDVSGASFDLTYPQFHLQGAAARPRGEFQSAAFYGSDGYQGPYQAGSTAGPIVPGVGDRVARWQSAGSRREQGLHG